MGTPIIKPPRNLALSILITLLFALPLITFAGIAPLVDNDMVKFHIADGATSAFVESATYNQSTDYFSLNTSVEIEMIQILKSNGELEYQLPIHSSDVHISIADFESGDYVINLKFKGNEDYVPTSLTKK